MQMNSWLSSTFAKLVGRSSRIVKLAASSGKQLKRRQSGGRAAFNWEMLEPRMLLTAATFTGTDGLAWNDANNWSTKLVPTSSDTVTFNAAAFSALDGQGVTVGSLNITGGTAAVNLKSTVNVAHTLTLSTTGGLHVSPGATFGGGGITINGSAPLTVAAGSTLNVDGATFNVPIVNQGTIVVANNYYNTVFNGAVTNALGANFQFVDGASANSSITVTKGFANSGTLLFNAISDNETFNAQQGILTNAAGGVINVTGFVPVGMSGNATVLMNFGTINVDAGQTFDLNSHQFVNTGKLVGPGTIDLSNSAVNLGTFTVTTATAQLDIYNTTFNGTGTLTVANGATLNVDGTTFNVPVVNQGTVVTSNSYYNTTFNGAVTNSAGASFQFVDGAAPNSSLTVTKGFTNTGTLQFSSVSDNLTFVAQQGGLTNAAGGVIHVDGFVPVKMGGNGTVLTNRGTINVGDGQTFDLDSHQFLSSGTLAGKGILDLSNSSVDLGAFTVTIATPELAIYNTSFKGTGALTVAKGATLNVNGTTFNVPLVNQGTVVVSNSYYNTTFNGHVSNGVGASFQFVDGASPNTAITVTNAFANSGTLLFAPVSDKEVFVAQQGGLFNVKGGVITVNGSIPVTVNGNGTVLTNQGTISVADGQSFSLNGPFLNSGALTGKGTIDLSNGPANLGTFAITAATAQLDIYNTTFNGTGTLTVASGATLHVDGTTFNVPVMNQGTVIVANSYYNSTFNGTATNAAGGSFQFVDGAAANTAVTATKGFTNAGTLLFSPTSDKETFVVQQGELLNAAGGVITSQGGTSGGNVTLNSVLTNQGTINVKAPVTLSGAFTNGATVNVATTSVPLLLQTIQGATYDDLGNVTLNGNGTSSKPQLLEVLSSNLGATNAGFTNNSVFNSLSLGNKTYAKLQDLERDHGGSTGAEAVYVNTLNVPAGTTLNLNGLHLYAAVRNISGTVINGTVTPALPFTTDSEAVFGTGTAGTFTVRVFGSPAATYSVTGGTLPSGLTLNATTGVLSGTPAATTGGVYHLTLTANSPAVTATQAFTLYVDQPASFTSAKSATFTMKAHGAFQVVAAGYPAPAFEYTGKLPTGVTFNPATGLLSGTPAAGTAGTYTLSLTATNHIGATATQTFTLTVVVDSVAPTLTGIYRSAPSGQVTNQSSVTFLVKFSEAVTGVNTNVATDFALTGTASTGAKIGTPTTSNGGLSWSIPVTGLSTTANGAVQLNLTHNTGIADLATNKLTTSTFNGQAYAIDHKAPTGAWTAVATPTKSAVGSVTIKFSEAVQNVTLGNFTLNGTKLSSLSGVTIAANTSTNTYVISGLSKFDTAAKTYTVAVISGNTLKDLAGNALSGTPSVSWVVSTTAPAAFTSPSAMSPSVSQLDEYWSTMATSGLSLSSGL